MDSKIVNNFHTVINGLRMQREPLQDEIKESKELNRFYLDVVTFFSNPNRSAKRDSLTDTANRYEPDIKAPWDGYVYKRGRPSVRLWGTTLGEHFSPLLFADSGNEITASIENDAPFANYYFRGTRSHIIDGNQLLVFWSGSPLPWNGARAKGANFTKYVTHPGAGAKQNLVHLLYQKNEKTIKKGLGDSILSYIRGVFNGIR